MAMGIVTDKDFEKEKTNLSTPTPKPAPITGEIKDVNRGRGVGSVEVPNPLRNIIGEESVLNGRQSAVELAQQFGISPSSVSAYGVGATSTASYQTRPNVSAINGTKERVAKGALGKLKKALRHITDDKLEAASAKDLAGIAKDMSAVVRTMEPETPKGSTGEKGNGPTFVFYAPQFHREEHYDIVHVKE